MERAYIRVTKDDNGIKRELVYAGKVVGELSFLETLELARQATSSLRFEK